MNETYMPGAHAIPLPLRRKNTLFSESPALCWTIVFVASLAAVSVIQPVAPLHVAGIAIICILTIIAMAAPWLGILALFPLAFSVATPPDGGIGAKEATFALLTLAILSRSTIECVLKTGISNFLRTYGLPILSGVVLLGINLIAAFQHQVPLADWLRGAAPFAFIFMSIPIAIALRSNPERVKWLGISVLAVAMVFCAYVLGYFALHRLWEYRWYLNVGGKTVEVSEAVARAHAATVQGPFIERITTLVPSSTDAFIPLTLAIGFVLATLAEEKRVRAFGTAMMALALATILVTYTRSMLLSPLLVIGAMCLYLAVFRRDRLKRATVLLTTFLLYGIIVIEVLGLQLAWLNRTSMLFAALKLQGLKLLNFVAGLALALSHVLTPTPPAATPSAAIPALASATTPASASAAAHASSSPAIPALASTAAQISSRAAGHASPRAATLTLATAARQPAASAAAHHPASAAPPPIASAATHASALAANTTATAQSSSHVVDDNVATRIDEYRVAWKMFLDHPVIGNGLGAKHPMSFVRSVDDVWHENVGYVHNWPLYMLMVGGLLGFAGYAFLLIRPIAFRYETPSLSGSAEIALRAGLSTLAIYSLFFAVVRLITYNLLVAAAWGVFLAFAKHIPAAAASIRGLKGQSFALDQRRASVSVRADSATEEGASEQLVA